jgi:hypothetical protein
MLLAAAMRAPARKRRPGLLAFVVGLAALVPLLASQPAHAFAVFKVDPYCPDPSVYSTIQDAVDAAAAYADADYFDYVWISNNTSYGGQHIVINDQRTVIIVGGFSDCSDNDPGTDHTTVSGAGNGGYPVFDITGNNSAVVLLNLYITGAQTSGSGGGIAFAGHGELDIGQTSLFLNEANYGGGINFYGDSNGAALYLWHDTTVLNNTANVSGGGVRVEGSARLYALEAQTWIGYNHANNGYGGGVEILGPARADIGSAGYNGVGVLSYNDAVNGGGAAAIPTSGHATLRIFTTDPANPVQIDNNVASSNGGGVYLGVGSDLSKRGVLCALSFRLHDNSGADGAAVFANIGLIYFNLDPFFPEDQCGPEGPYALGAVGCAAGAPCNEIAGNQAVDINAQPTNGAILSAGSATTLQGNRFSMRSNAAAVLIDVSGNEGDLPTFSRNCLIADNHTQHELLSIPDGRTFDIDGCTLTHNVIDSGYVMYANDNSFQLLNSIVDQPGYSVLDHVGYAGGVLVNFVIANEMASLSTYASNSQVQTPVYVDAANGDYHLARNSPGVDYAPAGSSSDTDLDGLPRDIDLAAVWDVYGPRDLGAYERSTYYACGTADSIFCDGFGP